ncbi:MAG: AMP-binding protein [Pseudomonadota bacterium]
MPNTLAHLINAIPNEALAFGAPDRDWLTYGDLRAHTATVRTSLRAAGIGSKDRIAIVLPNGPEMASAFITIAQCATTAPLNPAYKQEEFSFYMDDLKAKAVILEADYEGPARAAAEGLGLLILNLSYGENDAAGIFTLEANGTAASAADDTEPTADDIALILHTSGTTSRPKIVPLTQANIAASAQNIAKSLALKPKDRCLNVMPLFHIHGLVAAVSASLAAGASISCSPGFDVLRFFGWLKDVNPTWYTAVPTMHQAILSRAGRNQEIVENTSLRFLRSSSSSLPGPVMETLAQTFGVPVVEAYGMTEAAHQMCCNPIEPGRQKPGFVGLPAGPAVAIAHEVENHIIEGTGEIVISGPNVTPGYESNPDANEKSFFEADGKRWFRTGDQGQFDGDGYLSLTGRLKEIINRGGEKISPLEVDSVLSAHPAIAQVVCFAIPHDKLGEDVAAAVVCKEGQDITEREIRDFAAERLAAFKVPRKVLVLEEIPKGSTGKLQRIGLAEKLGLTA